VSLNGWYGFDSSKTPKEMSLNINTNGGDAVHSLPGVYVLDGDNLTISLSGVPASVPAGLAGKQPGVCYTLRREPPPKEEPKNRARADVSTPQVWPSPPRADVRREYTVTAKLMEAGSDKPIQIPKLALMDGQSGEVIISDGPHNLLDKVMMDASIKIGTIGNVRVLRLAENKVRLFLSFQMNEIEKATVSEIRVLGNSVQTIQDVELRKPLKVVYQKDAAGTAQRWVEVTVDELSATEQAAPAPAASWPQQKGNKH
jgi:hypothetical protein